MQQAAVGGADLPKLVTEAMSAIEDEFRAARRRAPQGLRHLRAQGARRPAAPLNSERIKQATGDVFGRIYEYFSPSSRSRRRTTMASSYTRPSIVQTIVNVIEPDHGIVFDPAAGSGGMFVQSSHFIEHEGGDTAKKVVFYGQEKEPRHHPHRKNEPRGARAGGKIAERSPTTRTSTTSPADATS